MKITLKLTGKGHLENKYPTKYMGKTTDTFWRLKFRLPVNLPFLADTYAASRDSYIELLILVSDFMVNIRLKILKGISVESMECLNEHI